MRRDTSRKAPLTVLSTHRVSQLLTGRGTISVPTALAHAVSTSKAPAAAAIERPMSGITINPPSGQRLCRAPPVPASGARDLLHEPCHLGQRAVGGGKQARLQRE